MKIFKAWLVNSKGDPVNGTDRILKGTNKQNVIKHLCYEESVSFESLNPNTSFVPLSNGNKWFVIFSHNQK